MAKYNIGDIVYQNDPWHAYYRHNYKIINITYNSIYFDKSQYEVICLETTPDYNKGDIYVELELWLSLALVIEDD